MTHDANGAIEVLQNGLKEDEKEGNTEGTVDGAAFREADTLVRPAPFPPIPPSFQYKEKRDADVKGEISCYSSWRGPSLHSAGTPRRVRCS